MALKHSKRMGKSEARAKFLPLVQALARGGGPIEITDRGRVEAVLLSNEDYQRLLVCSKMQLEPARPLTGSMVLVEDLEQAEREVSALFMKSISRSVEAL